MNGGMTSAAIALPIIVSESGDVIVFASIEAAERGLESIDVENGIYDLYDATGLRLEALPGINKVSIRRMSPERYCADEARTILCAYLRWVEPGEKWFLAATLEELVAYMYAHYRLDS